MNDPAMHCVMDDLLDGEVFKLAVLSAEELSDDQRGEIVRLVMVSGLPAALKIVLFSMVNAKSIAKITRREKPDDRR